MLVYFLSLFVSSSFAAMPRKLDAKPIRFTYEVRLQGRQICSGTQVVPLGQAVEICRRFYNESTVKFRAEIQPIGNEQFMVSGSVSEYEKDGMPALLSKPRISALRDEKAQISILNQDNVEEMSMSVLVNPMN
jgi:hypothetical protein